MYVCSRVVIEMERILPQCQGNRLQHLCNKCRLDKRVVMCGGRYCGSAMPNGANRDATTRLALARARERMRFGRANPRTVVAPIAGRSARTGDDALRLYSDFADGEGLGDAGFGNEAQEADAGALAEGTDTRLLRDGSRARPHAAIDGDLRFQTATCIKR